MKICLTFPILAMFNSNLQFQLQFWCQSQSFCGFASGFQPLLGKWFWSGFGFGRNSDQGFGVYTSQIVSMVQFELIEEIVVIQTVVLQVLQLDLCFNSLL